MSSHLICLFLALIFYVGHMNTFSHAVRFQTDERGIGLIRSADDSVIASLLSDAGAIWSEKTLLGQATHAHLKSIGLEDRPTQFSKEEFQHLLQQHQEYDGHYSESAFDMGDAQVYARLSSIAYCSNSTVINAWNCTRCSCLASRRSLLVFLSHMYYSHTHPVYMMTDASGCLRSNCILLSLIGNGTCWRMSASFLRPMLSQRCFGAQIATRGGTGSRTSGDGWYDH